jgi:hypothetical protein
MVFMPLFFAFAVELVVFWRNDGRSEFLLIANQEEGDDGWSTRVQASSFTFWSVLLICLGFAGLLQWVGVRLIPLTSGGSDYAIDWGTLALVRPEVISVPQAIAFTGFSYLYMCLCFYLFFAGLILLFTLAHDLGEIGFPTDQQTDEDCQRNAEEIGLRVMLGIFRCTLSGILVAVCMKLQSFYLTTDSENIFVLLVDDMSSVLSGRIGTTSTTNYSTPTHYTSLIITLATLVVFVYSFIRLAMRNGLGISLGRMATAVTILTISYLMIGAFAGFTILLSAGVLVSIYGLFDPGLGTRHNMRLEDKSSVS